MSLRRRLRLMTHPWRLVVERLATDAGLPPLPREPGLFALVWTRESLTVVRPLAESDTAGTRTVWRALEIAGPFAFSETGVLAAVAQPLADAGVSIFAVNSYETDFVLVQEQDLERAREALAVVGHGLD